MGAAGQQNTARRTACHSSIFRKWWWAAASIVCPTGAYLLFINKPEKRQDIAAATVTDDIKPPITNRATVMLANGKTVYLDSAVNGTLAIQGNVQVVKLADGQIAYQGSATELAYNTLTNPRGSKVIDMALADGSHVWLNAGSSVTYPIAFIGNERKVSITGEAYFEIAHNAAKPFMVSKGEMQVQVLGTHFNVSAYDDEDAIRVTLLEGSVEVKSQKSKVRIVPGEQAVLASHSLLTINHSPDPEQVMAWKNGLFQFHSAGLPDVMKQLSRWYDVDIVYEGKTPVREFEGKIQRDLTLSQALKILEKNQVHFRVENRKLIVLP